MEWSDFIDRIYPAFIESNYHLCTDSRALKPGDIFLCLKGDRFDGNQFAVQAIEQGARIVIVDSEALKSDARFVYIENSLTALQQLAKHHFAQMSCKKIIVGGSNGKTTTKEVSRTVLSAAGNTLATPGNWNNHIGVPLTLLSVTPSHEFAIIELGTNHPGEMKVLCDLISPDAGIITNIGKEHLEGFGDIETVAKEESEVYLSLMSNHGLAIVNIDDDWLNSMKKRLSNQLTISTLNKEANFYAQIHEEMPLLTFDLYHQQILVGSFSSSLSGRYNAYNLLFGTALGVSSGLNAAESMSLACQYVPSNNRSEWRTINGIQIFLDAYNANPSSMTFAIQSFATLKGNKQLFLGDMLELGDHSESEHIALLELCTSLGIQENTFLVGAEFCEACPNHPYRFETIDALLAWLDTHPMECDFAFIKGSRGIKMERLLEHFQSK
jgi:UDP-N-acetylmuramoyl-tripeptide--D-alanyl-D-alanine ligase